MYLAYLIALIPIAIGCVFYISRKEIVLWEWLVGASVGLITAAVFNVVAVMGMTDDIETWSGQITATRYYPKWVEKYKVAIYRTEHRTRQETRYRTVGSGKHSHTQSYSVTVSYSVQVFDHWEDRFRTHGPDWMAYISYGRCSDSIGINQAFYEDIKKNFGGKVFVESPGKGGFYSGDPHTYLTNNETGYIYPSTIEKKWTNKIKASPSLFSFVKVPEGTPVFDYPTNKNWQVSDRVMGAAKDYIGILDWDRLNARLGPSKKCNLIIVGFKSGDSSLGQLQQAKWVGGKKNDLVLTFGVDTTGKIAWSYVFGWTEKETVKKDLQTILMDNPLNGSILPKIESSVFNNYLIKDWSKFDYLTVEPPSWSYLILITLMVLSQIGFYYFAFNNGEDKDSKGSRYEPTLYPAFPSKRRG